MSWFTKPGDLNSDKFKIPNAVGGQLFRFWLKGGEKKKVFFLGDEKLGVHEHMEQIGRTWEKFTCSRNSECYFCGTGKRSTFVEYSTILDLTPYKSKTGELRKYSKRAFPAYGSALEVLNRRRQEKGGSLVGYGVECIRDTDKSPNVGNDFVVSAEKYDPKALFPEAKEFDFKLIEFEKFLAPLPLEGVLAKLKFAGITPQTTKRSDIINNPDDDNSDIPF